MSARKTGGILKKINCMSDEITNKFAIGNSLRRLCQKLSDQAKFTVVDILNKLTAKLIHTEKALIKTLISEEGRIKMLKAEEGFVGTLISEEDRTKKLKAEEGSIKELISENNKMKKLEARRASINQLESDGAYMKRLVTPYAITDELNAADAKIYKKLTAKDAEMNSLKTEEIASKKIETEEMISSGKLSAGETTVSDGLTIKTVEEIVDGESNLGGLTISTSLVGGNKTIEATLTAKQLNNLNLITAKHITALNNLINGTYTFNSLYVNNNLTVENEASVKSLKVDDIPVKKIFIGTKAQWDALSQTNKKKYDMAAIDDL